MTTKLILAAGFIALLGAEVASAHGNVSCNVPRKERRPSVELQRLLQKDGWVVRKLQVYNGCYEVYGRDPAGNSVEAFFDPRTLKRLKVD